MIANSIEATAARIVAGIMNGGSGSIRQTQEAGAGPSFQETLRQAINGVSDTQDAAHDIIARFVRGEDVPLHQVMAAQEEAGLHLEALVESRNKVLDAFKNLTSIQV